MGVYYLSWIVGSTKIILFLDMLKFSKIIFLNYFFLVKENEAYFGVFGNILFVKMKSLKKI